MGAASVASAAGAGGMAQRPNQVDPPPPTMAGPVGASSRPTAPCIFLYDAKMVTDATPTSDRGREMLEAYLPGTLIQRWARDPLADPIWQETVVGSLMLCDMSGFTAMSERLAGLGKEGAELMAGILNRFFSRMLGVAAGWGGVQMKFGGDAMLLFFSGDHHAACAAACALEMQRAMPEFGGVEAGGERHRLRMRVGIHSGAFFSASAGQPDGVLHYLLMGPDVNRTAGVEGEAEPGQVVASAETAALLKDSARLSAVEGGCWRVTQVDEPPRPPVAPPPTAAPAGILRRYLMPPLAAPLAEGHTPNFAAEHRSVTAVFINLFGVADLLAARGAVATLKQVDTYLKLVLLNLEAHGGFLGGSDAAETGDKLIALFGAPVASEGTEVNALRFALDLDRDLAAAGLDLTHRIGVSSGFVFAGEIGSAHRREYTVIGDSVNLAARLMSAAPAGQIYVSAATADRARGAFDLRRLRALTLKGKSGRVPAFRLIAAREAPASPESAPLRQMVGRESEIATLLDVAGLARRGTGRWAFLSGQPGIGKSRLAAEIAARLRDDGWRLLATSSQSYRSRAVLSAWIEPLRTLFGIEPSDGAESAWGKLRDEVERLQPEQAAFTPLVADLLGIPSEDVPMLRFMDPRTRRAQLARTIIGLLESTARERPLLLTFEDVHLSDLSSLDLLAEMLARPPSSMLVLLTSREGLPGQLSGRTPDVSLQLAELAGDEARRFVSTVADLDENAIEAILAKAQGNPLFLEEMALGGLGHRDVPQTINEVIMARLDHLPYAEKSVLRTASVMGATFRVSYIEKLLGDGLGAAEVAFAVAHLGEHGFIREHRAGDVTHAFSHTLAQEVIYETLPYAQRRKLHSAIGGFIEEERTGQLPSVSTVLLYHFEGAGDASKIIRYATMAGDGAARVFANREAIDYYGRALDALQRTKGATARDRSTLLERIGDSLEMDGRHGAATQAFIDALEEWSKGPRARRTLLAPSVPTPDAARAAALCRRVAVSFERRSEYDESLKWLDRALEVLPARSGRTGAEVYASKSMTLFRKGLYRDAIDWGRRAVAKARRTRERRSLAYAHNMLANSYIEEGSVRQAIRHLNAAVQIYRDIGDVYGLAAANNNLGNCYSAVGALDAAIRHYEIALMENRRAGNDAAIVHNNLGEVLLIQGRLDDAVEHLRAVLRAKEANPDLTAIAGYAEINLSRCLMAVNDVPTAEEHLRRGARLLRSVGARGLLIEARLQLAELRLEQGRGRDALREARRGLAEARAMEARLTEASAERIVGNAESALGRHAEALARFEASVSLARKIGADLEEARGRLASAQISLGSETAHRPRGLTESLRRAEDILARMGAQRELEEARRLLALLSGLEPARP